MNRNYHQALFVTFVLVFCFVSAVTVQAVEPTLPEHFAIREMLKNNQGEKALIDAKALSAKGDSYGHYVAGLLLMGQFGVKAEWVTAAAYMEKAAETGCSSAEGLLGAILCDGPKEIFNIKKAIMYLERAAAKNNKIAFDMLARLYSQGLGLRKDLKKAREYFAKAADLGYPQSQKRLGIMLFDGEGGKKDQKNAVIWWNRAASAGNPNALFLLGHINENGKFVKKDLVEAAKFYILASPKAEAVTALNNLKKSMSVAQYEEAQSRARTWKFGEPWVSPKYAAATNQPQPKVAVAEEKSSLPVRSPANNAPVPAELDAEAVDSWPQSEPIMEIKQIEQFILKDYCAD